MTEQAIQKQILDWLKDHGIWAVKILAANKSGIPDILACIDGKFVAIEVKRPGGRVSELQRHNLEMIRSAGGVAIVAYGVEDVAMIYDAIAS